MRRVWQLLQDVPRGWHVCRMGKPDHQHFKGGCRIWRFADLLMPFQQHLPCATQLGNAQITERGNARAFTLDQIGKICASGD